MIYLSLVGTQVMAVLNPLLALHESGIQPDEIILLHTAYTKSKAEKIMGYLKSEPRFQNKNVQIIEVLYGSTPSPSGIKTAEEEIVKFVSNNLYLNFAGGLNYQIAAYIMKINFRNCHFLYPERDCVHVISLQNGTIIDTSYSLPKPLPVKDVLDLQEVKHDVNAVIEEQLLLNNLLKNCYLTLPDEKLEHVKIGNVIFDYVWNTYGNELKFIKVLFAKGNDTSLADKFLQDSRALDTIALNREDFGELYHRSILVLTNNHIIAERINMEGGGKISVIKVYYPFEKRDCDKLKTFLDPPATHYELNLQGKQYEEYDTNSTITRNTDAVLFTTLGLDILPTLITIWSHNVSEAILLFTPNIPIIEEMKKAIIDNRHLLPLKKISFCPVSISGVKDLHFPNRMSGKDIQVNLTPGTKGHTFSLSLMAKRFNTSVYSIDTAKQKIVNVTDGAELTDTKGPDPLTLLRLKGGIINNKGENTKYIKRQKYKYKPLLRFLRKIINNGEIKNFPRENIQLGQTRYTVKNGSTGILSGLGKGKINYQFNYQIYGGYWFEELMGHVLLECGADDVCIRIRTAWPDETQRFLEKKYINTEFVESEFRRDKKIENLCNSIKNTNLKDIIGNTNNSIDLLNNLLTVPDLYDKAISINDYTRKINKSHKLQYYAERTTHLRKSNFADLNDEEQFSIRRLNRVLLETIFSKHTPKSKSVFMTDLDVIARFGSNYYVISCKATLQRKVDEDTLEAQAFKSSLARFAVPLVAYFYYDKEPDCSKNDVYIFGYKTFTDNKNMKELLKKAMTRKRKVHY